MKGFTPELVERVGYAIQRTITEDRLCSVHESFERRARAALEASGIAGLTEALQDLRSYGCPACSGCCGSANPPVTNCPMQKSREALANVGLLPYPPHHRSVVDALSKICGDHNTGEQS